MSQPRISQSRKKVIVRLLAGNVVAGYLPVSGLLDDGGAVSLLDLDARIRAVPLSEVRHIAYVRDFNLGEVDPERLARKTFLARPRSEGVWLRLTMAGGEMLEGLAAPDVGLVDGLLEDGGIYLTPADMRSNTQRLFVPRGAFTAMQVVGVITAPAKVVSKKAVKDQTSLFP